METTVYSKPTDAHLYLNANSSHPKSQILGIAKGVALRLRRICSRDADFWEKSRIYMKYLTDCGHDIAHVNRAFEVVGAMTREEARIVDVKFVVIPVFLLPSLIPVLLIFEKFFVNIALF